MTSRDALRVFPAGDIDEGRAEALAFFCADGGRSSTDELSSARLAASSFQRELQDEWRLSVCATASDRARSVMIRALKRANRQVFQRGIAETPARDLSCSMACGLLYRGVLIHSNLGNVRLLVQRGGEFLRLTEDHTYSSALARRGLLTHGTQNHPFAHLVSKRLGSGNELDCKLRGHIMRPNDVLLAMTDGMGNLRSSRFLNKRLGLMIREWLANGMPPSEANSLFIEQLRYYANEEREDQRDDATCLAIEVEPDDLLRPLVQRAAAWPPSPTQAEAPRRPATRDSAISLPPLPPLASDEDRIDTENHTPSVFDSQN